MTSCSPPIERARPLLGTTVAIRVAGLAEKEAHRAIDEAFGEIALIHRLMSFHETDSDISRLNRGACDRAAEVHPHTFEVLREAQKLARESEGCFDITVATELVDCRILPEPQSRYRPDPAADWRDVELLEYRCVHFRRPLWIDLGGIAKGYAVDRAVEILAAHHAVQACVNAGGDLRVVGPQSERVYLKPEQLEGDAAPILDVSNAAIASSSGHLDRRFHAGQLRGPHIDGATRRAIPTDRFVSVAAERCVIADALTKVVLAWDEASDPLLRRYGASAHLHDPRRGWRHIGLA
jgi:thiamine biosynthesis lipoprotein